MDEFYVAELTDGKWTQNSPISYYDECENWMKLLEVKYPSARFAIVKFETFSEVHSKR